MSLLYPAFLWLLIPLVLLLWSIPKRSVQLITHSIILGLFIISLARPVIKEGVKEGKVEARDIIIALDVSYSMRAKDIQPSRYIFAKNTIEALLARYPKDNIMLIAFTSNPLLLSPPTTDHTLILTALKSLNPEYILTKGTSLEKLFEKIKKMHSDNKDLILITDGGEEQNTEALSAQLKEAQVHLSILALGTASGATIENPDGSLVKDKEAHLIVSRINPMLKSLADTVQGDYLTPASSAEATATVLHNILEAQSQNLQEVSKKQHSYTELYQLPLLLALLLFLLMHTRASKYLLIILTFAGIQAEASVWDGYYLHKAYTAYAAHDFNISKHILNSIQDTSLQSRLLKANTYYHLGAYKQAITLYQSIRSTKPKIKQMLFYNTANAYTCLKEYDKAKIYYTKALQLGEDADALHNLNLVVLLEQKAKAGLGIAHPKSQNSDASKSKSQESSDEKKGRDEDQPSSGSGTGGESKEEKSHKKEKHRLTLDKDAEVQPLSSKVYELINKGYIRETHPW